MITLDRAKVEAKVKEYHRVGPEDEWMKPDMATVLMQQLAELYRLTARDRVSKKMSNDCEEYEEQKRKRRQETIDRYVRRCF